VVVVVVGAEEAAAVGAAAVGDESELQIGHWELRIAN
jgi:hypothetical protein